MQRYIVLYRAPLTVAQRFAQATPEEAMKGMQLWTDWAKKVGPGLVDPGKPLGNAMRVTKDNITKSDSDVIGMSILQANTMDEALQMVKDHHHLHWAENCEIVLLEEMPIPELESTSR
ncbi:MAG: hypothetical protein JWO40_238 [Candidatus Doudnabacteria bacterium]|nr:hypothetical protein [Candidatus Doudnabacteria bacterium]